MPLNSPDWRCEVVRLLFISMMREQLRVVIKHEQAVNTQVHCERLDNLFLAVPTRGKRGMRIMEIFFPAMGAIEK
jgi:hypothetical protein